MPAAQPCDASAFGVSRTTAPPVGSPGEGGTVTIVVADAVFGVASSIGSGVAGQQIIVSRGVLRKILGDAAVGADEPAFLRGTTAEELREMGVEMPALHARALDRAIAEL